MPKSLGLLPDDRPYPSHDLSPPPGLSGADPGRNADALFPVDQQENQERRPPWARTVFYCPLDDAYLIRAARQVELNPVRVGLVAKAADWPWSSDRSHLEGGEDCLLAGDPWPPEDWRSEWPEILSEPDDPEIFAAIRKHTHTGHGHLFGSASFIT